MFYVKTIKDTNRNHAILNIYWNLSIMISLGFRTRVSLLTKKLNENDINNVNTVNNYYFCHISINLMVNVWSWILNLRNRKENTKSIIILVDYAVWTDYQNYLMIVRIVMVTNIENVIILFRVYCLIKEYITTHVKIQRIRN